MNSLGNRSSENETSSILPSDPTKRAPHVRLKDGSFLSLERPVIMGILNVTPDSFSDGGNYLSTECAVEHGMEMIRHGAGIVDIGGESTRPFSDEVPVEKEIRRVIPVIRGLVREMEETGIRGLVSIDTKKPEVARRAVEAGAEMVNDVSALGTNGMAEMITETGVPVVLMHMIGSPENMQIDPHYNDVVNEVIDYLNNRVQYAVSCGISLDKTIVDPGIGFGKTKEHNLLIMKNLKEFEKTGRPILIGTSNKSFIGKTLGLEVNDRLEGTLATGAYSVLNGVCIIRVHDVRASRRVVDMTLAMMNAR